jgi:hypothetical protein
LLILGLVCSCFPRSLWCTIRLVSLRSFCSCIIFTHGCKVSC